MRFLWGFMIGLLFLGGYLGYEQYQLGQDPCLGRCGQDTHCVVGTCLVLETEEPSPPRKRRKGSKRRRRLAESPAAVAQEEALQQPTAADLKMVSEGPSLRNTDYINMADYSESGRELEREEIDAKVRRQDPQIIACIDQARGTYALHQGQVIVRFRIERSGEVQQLRISAPALLQRAGLFQCLKPLFTRLSFGPSSRALIMSYPYALH
jgi:hypothetical protein